MNIISSGVFWGLLLVFIGLSIIVKVLFHIDIPVFRIVMGILLLYLGFHIIFGNSSKNRERKISIEKHYRGNLTNSNSSEYNIVFSSGTIDLTDWQEKAGGNYIEVNVVFGSGVVLINPSMNLVIEANTVFGEAILPGNRVSFLGSKKLQLPTEGEEVIYLGLNTVFGSVIVKEKNG